MKIMFENFGYYLAGFKSFVETGDVLTKKERMLLEWCDYLLATTKFKKIALNYFNDITFKSSNRNFKLEINDDNTFSLSYYYNGNGKDYSTISDINKSIVSGDFYKLRSWFKKRNYLK